MKRAHFSCQGVISALHHAPHFMGKAWLLIVQ